MSCSPNCSAFGWWFQFHCGEIELYLDRWSHPAPSWFAPSELWTVLASSRHHAAQSVRKHKHILKFNFDPTCLSNINLFICVILPPTLWSSDHSHASRLLRDRCEHADSVCPLCSRASVWAHADPISWRTHATSSSLALSCWLLQNSSLWCALSSLPVFSFFLLQVSWPPLQLQLDLVAVLWLAADQPLAVLVFVPVVQLQVEIREKFKIYNWWRKNL